MVRRLEDLVAYQVAMQIGDEVWNVVNRWAFFEKDTLGKQITRSADSIALNIAEGYGRFHFKENKNFCYHARGSQFETQSALVKAKTRHLIDEKTFELINQKLEHFHKLINGYIKSIGPNDNTNI
ncbi:MAG: hypothetical protein JWQ09_4755 [Segetibacter sp.]|nr:hypothetical protein [Segetibacter sp.]